MTRVYTAEPYRWGGLGSTGSARYMLLRQHNFPDTYSQEDKYHHVDHDRLMSWEETSKAFYAACQTHMKTGDLGIGQFALNATPEQIMEFMLDAMSADRAVKWTGFRILGTVNRSNGGQIFSLELFAKHPNSNTKVYSDENAPNVQGYQEREEDGYVDRYGRSKLDKDRYEY